MNKSFNFKFSEMSYKCACDETPDKTVKNILEDIGYECPMCTDIVRAFSKHNWSGTWLDSKHSHYFRNRNIHKAFDFLKAKDDLQEAGLWPKFLHLENGTRNQSNIH
jgi:hypothetical protein